MAVDVSGLTSALISVPGQNVANIQGTLERAYQEKQQALQQQFQNHYLQQKAALEQQEAQGKITLDQLKINAAQADFVGQAAQGFVQVQDPNQKVFLLKQALGQANQLGIPQEGQAALIAAAQDPEMAGSVIARTMAAKDYLSQKTPPEPKAPTTRTIQQGMEKVYQEWDPDKRIWKEVGRGVSKEGTTVNVYNEKASLEFTKAAVGQMTEATKQANIARRANSVMEFGERALKGIDTGSLSEVQLGLGKVASSLGIQIGKIPDMEAAKGAYGELVKAQLNAFPGAISEGERTYAVSISPQLTSTPQGRRKLSGLMKELNDRAIAYQQQMDKYIKSNPTKNLYKDNAPSFVEEWDDYMAKHPLSIMEEQVKPSREAISPEAWSSSPQAFKSKDNTEYRNIGGKWLDRTGKEYNSGR